MQLRFIFEIRAAPNGVETCHASTSLTTSLWVASSCCSTDRQIASRTAYVRDPPQPGVAVQATCGAKSGVNARKRLRVSSYLQSSVIGCSYLRLFGRCWRRRIGIHIIVSRCNLYSSLQDRRENSILVAIASQQSSGSGRHG